MREKTVMMACCLVLTLALTMILPSLAQAQAGTPTETYGTSGPELNLATGSPGELGLLKALVQAYAAKTPVRLNWYKAGSGEALALFKDRKVDLILAHAPAAEKKAVAEGWATRRHLLGSNEFFIVGPADDPSGVAQAGSAVQAFQALARGKAPVFSRGDDSGTHRKEMSLWKAAGIEPQGAWYVVTKAFMTATLIKASEAKGYFMLDSSTWVAEKAKAPNLKVLYRGDKALVNVYHSLCQPEGATPGAALAGKFIDFLVSPEGQAIMARFGAAEHGEPLYNDAAYAKKYDD